MKISYNWIQNYFDKKLPKPHELAELINAHVFEVESETNVGDDTVFDIKVMPDRAHYALCHKGIAREVRAITGQEMNKNVTKDGFPVNGSVPAVKVDVKERKLCRRYIARMIENVSIGQSPTDLKNKLEAIDARSINTIVDATNYVMFDIGQPLHAFDADKVRGGITVRLAKKNEKIELLDSRVIELNETDLVIADDEGPIAIAGVKGGKRAEISASTKNIILESANFDPVSVRRTSTRLNLRNDSSKRFENDIIPELAEEAMHRVTDMIMEFSKNAKAGLTTDVFPMPTKHWSVSVRPSFISEKLGMDVQATDLKEILVRYDCVIKEEGDMFVVTPPSDRLDLKIEEDFVDEVARVRGYDKLDAVLPVSIKSDLKDAAAFYWAEKIKNVLIGLGFSETLLYSLVAKGFYEITYPLASDKSSLRESIVGKMKEALVMNTLNADLLGLNVAKIFEIGKVFPKEGEKTVLCLGVKNVKKSKKKEPEIIKDTLSEIEKIVGKKIDAKILDNVAEIDFVELIKGLNVSDISDLNFRALPRDQKYHLFSPYPFITRDIAVFVPDTVIGDGVWKAIKQGVQEAGAEDLLVRDSLFDVFKKDGKISYAYRLVFQSYKKTLTDEEVNKIMEKIYVEVREKEGWEVR